MSLTLLFLLFLLSALDGALWLWAAQQGSWWAFAWGLVPWLLVMVWMVRDALAFRALRRWLRSQGRMPLPNLHGRWQELSHHMQRWDKRRKRQRDAQAQRLQAFLHALKDAPFGLVLLAENDSIQWCNATAASHLQIHPERDVQQRIAFIVRLPSFVQLLQKGQGSIRWQTADGLDIEVLLHVWQPNQRLLLTRDISQEERVLTMQKDFVAHVSHEIRTPLTVLLGFADSLLHLPLSENERQVALQHMQQQGNHMLSMVEDLLQLAHLEAQRVAPQLQTLVVSDLLQRCVEAALLWQKAWLKQQTPSTDIAPTLSIKGLASSQGGAQAPTLLGNAKELESAIGNLLRNALRYAPAGSCVQLLWTQDDSTSTIAVRDQGPGIAPWHLARLGEPFYRVENGHGGHKVPHGTAAAGHAGTGLGLAIVRQIARRHEGELRIESQPQKGSTFSIRLPRRVMSTN